MKKTESIVSTVNPTELAAQWTYAYFRTLEHLAAATNEEIKDTHELALMCDAGYGAALFALGFKPEMVEEIADIAREMRANVRSGDCMCGHCKDN